MPGKRLASQSLCCHPGPGGAYRFHKCVASGSVTCFVDNDLQRELNNLSMPKQYILQANVKKVIKEAKKGTLAQSTDTRYNPLAAPCASKPDIWELRWNIFGELYRMYYSEDGTRNPEFVALSFTHKITHNLTNAQIKTNQNAAIAQAQSLYDRYKGIHWGHAKSNCKHCM
ncbi:hypothetical protein DKK73_05145 [Bifidobacterium asteroides]|nr:hypothetical protein DKK73_05145 [Bifidobacterium asteroides]